VKIRLTGAAVVAGPVVVAAAVVAGYAAGQWAGAGADRARLDAALATARRAAYTDRLTGLPNRAAFDAELARRARRGERYALLLVDLDRFKPVNDMFGHAAGDVVLVAVAGRLAGLAPAGGFAARLGGDEFVLITAAGLGRRLGDEVHRAVAAPVPVGGGREVSVGASVGVAYARPGVPAGEVLRRADEAMYRAKAGRPSVVEHADTGTGTGGQPGGRSSVRLREMRHLVGAVGPVGAGQAVTR